MKKYLLPVLILILLIILSDTIFQINLFVFFAAIISNLLLIYHFTPKVEFLSDVITLEAVLIGVAIPLSLQVVNWTADKYRDNEIAKFFVNERIYKIQFLLLLSNILIVILLRFWGTTNSLLLWVVFIWLIGNIIIFYKFIKLVEQYATNADRYLLGRLKKHVRNILQ